MNTEHEWQPWQLRVLGFGLPWWFLLAPRGVNGLWQYLLGAPPAWLNQMAGFCYILLPIGAFAALAALSLDESSTGTKIVARWFLLGLLTVILRGLSVGFGSVILPLVDLSVAAMLSRFK